MNKNPSWEKSDSKVYVYEGGLTDGSSFFDGENDDYENAELNDEVYSNSKIVEAEAYGGECDASIKIESLFEKIDTNKEIENIMNDFILLNKYLDKNPNRRNEHKLSNVPIPDEYSYLLDNKEENQKNIVKEKEETILENKLLSENQKLKILKNAIEILEDKETIASLLKNDNRDSNYSITSTLKTLLGTNSTTINDINSNKKYDENNNLGMSQLTGSNEMLLSDKPLMRPRLKSKNKEQEDDFTTEEKIAIRSMLSKSTPINYNNSFLQLDPLQINQMNFAQNYNKSMIFNRNDFYNQQRAFINKINNAPPPPQYQNGHSLNFLQTNSLVNANLIKSFNNSQSMFMNDSPNHNG